VAIVRDAASLDVIQTTLEAQGIQVLAAGDAEEGWDLIHRTHVDAILVEAGWPTGLACWCASRTGIRTRMYCC
jgi:DNA-binding response OmpR family regulator